MRKMPILPGFSSAKRRIFASAPGTYTSSSSMKRRWVPGARDIDWFRGVSPASPESSRMIMSSSPGSSCGVIDFSVRVSVLRPAVPRMIENVATPESLFSGTELPPDRDEIALLSLRRVLLSDEPGRPLDPAIERGRLVLELVQDPRRRVRELDDVPDGDRKPVILGEELAAAVAVVPDHDA